MREDKEEVNRYKNQLMNVWESNFTEWYKKERIGI